MSKSGAAISVAITVVRRSGVLLAFIRNPVIRDQPESGERVNFFGFSQLPATVGRIVSATSRETQTAMAMVSARSANSCPSTSCRNSTGRKMATVVAVEASKAP